MINQELVSPALVRSEQEGINSQDIKNFRNFGFKHPCDRCSEPYNCAGVCSAALKYEMLSQRTQIEI